MLYYIQIHNCINIVIQGPSDKEFDDNHEILNKILQFYSINSSEYTNTKYSETLLISNKNRLNFFDNL